MQILVMLLLTPLSAVLSGLTLTVLWRWFMVPVFALPALTIPQALGVSLLVGFLTHQSSSSAIKKTTVQMWVDFTSHAFLRPLFALGLGAIYLLFL